MKKLFAWYVRTPLVVLNIAAFVLGCVGGLLVWKLGASGYSVASDWIISVLQPFGNVLIFMLKMNTALLRIFMFTSKFCLT